MMKVPLGQVVALGAASCSHQSKLWWPHQLVNVARSRSPVDELILFIVELQQQLEPKRKRLLNSNLLKARHAKKESSTLLQVGDALVAQQLAASDWAGGAN